MRNKDSVKQISIEYNDSNTLKFYISKKVEKQPLKQQKNPDLLPVFIHNVE